MACNKHHLKQFSSYIQLKRSRFADFRSSRERESGTVTFNVSLFSALAESSSGRCGTFVCYCWMMLRVDGCLNEDPGPLPGPRSVFLPNSITIGAASESQDIRDL